MRPMRGQSREQRRGLEKGRRWHVSPYRSTVWWDKRGPGNRGEEKLRMKSSNHWEWSRTMKIGSAKLSGAGRDGSRLIQARKKWVGLRNQRAIQTGSLWGRSTNSTVTTRLCLRPPVSGTTLMQGQQKESRRFLTVNHRPATLSASTSIVWLRRTIMIYT
jgi:hypothetical protein